MTVLAPNHVKDFCKQEIDSCFWHLKSEFDEWPFCNVYQIECSCGDGAFKIEYDEHPSAWCICSHCGKIITLYDLIFYPAAEKLPNEEKRKTFTCDNTDLFNICVMYEYVMDYESNDDISWFNLWCRNIVSGKIVNLINDETT